MKTLVVTNEQASMLKKGCLVVVNGVKIVLDTNGKPCIAESNYKPYPAVLPSSLRPNDTLNLTDDETKQAMIYAWHENENDRAYLVYRSSGAKNESGKPLTREEQIKLNKARKIKVLATPLENTPMYSNDPTLYKWSCFEPVVVGEQVHLQVIAQVEEF